MRGGRPARSTLHHPPSSPQPRRSLYDLVSLADNIKEIRDTGKEASIPTPNSCAVVRGWRVPCSRCSSAGMSGMVAPAPTLICTPAPPVRLLLLILLLLVGIVSSSRSNSRGRGEDCMQAQRRCASKLGCSIALSNYMLSCGPVVHGQTDMCTRECRMALVTLLSMEDRQGETFMTCDCDGNQMCLDQKERLEVCSGEVVQAMTTVMDNVTDISCSQAQMICSADTSCYTALSYYHTHCRRLMRGEKCTARCNNSLQILYNRSKARKLRTCLCEGTEDYNCPELKYNTETLCFRRQPDWVTRVPPQTTTHKHRHHHHNSHPHHTPTPPTPPHIDSNGGVGEQGESSTAKADICDQDNKVETDAPLYKGGDKEKDSVEFAYSSSSRVTPGLLAVLYLLTYSLSHCVSLLNVFSSSSCHL